MNDRHTVIEDVWNNHENEEWRRDQSHWRGHGRWTDDDLWQAIGRESVSKLQSIWRLLGRSPIPEPFTVLEWGPGGGSNVFAFRRLCEAYYGVDISSANLDECGRMISEEGYPGLFRPVLLRGDPATVVDTVKQPVDVFLSTAVFQHFPSKEYGAEVLAAVRSVCNENAIGIIQIRYDNGNEKFRPISDISEYKEKHITANSYNIDYFWNMLYNAGFTPLMIRNIDSEINYATFYFEAA